MVHPARAGLCIAALIAAGCSTDRAFFISNETEREVGVEVDKQIRQEFQVCEPPTCPAELLGWVNDLGQKLAARSERPSEVPYSFTVLHTDQVNAFAAPGGFLYITTGLLRLAEDTSEVAGVLGHEIGHIVERHGAEQMEAQLGVELLNDVILGDSEAAQTAAAILFNGGLIYYSKDKELEADTHGVLLTSAVKLTPDGLIDFFTLIRNLYYPEGNGGPLSDIENALSSHPHPNDRISHVKDVMQEQNIDPSAFPADTQPPFSQIRALLPPPAGDI